jgi:hypothetical protein
MRNFDKKDNYAYEATKGIHEADELANIFFSQDNIERLQQAIRYNVYRSSGGKHVIDKQSEQELKIIMRYYYLDYGSYRSFMIQDEIEKLNTMVIRYCVPRILNEIEMYLKFLNDSEKDKQVMEHSINTSIKGNKSIEMKPFL